MWGTLLVNKVRGWLPWFNPATQLDTIAPGCFRGASSMGRGCGATESVGQIPWNSFRCRVAVSSEFVRCELRLVLR